MRNFIEEIINQHNYVLSDMEERICKLFAVWADAGSVELTYAARRS